MGLALSVQPQQIFGQESAGQNALKGHRQETQKAVLRGAGKRAWQTRKRKENPDGVTKSKLFENKNIIGKVGYNYQGQGLLK